MEIDDLNSKVDEFLQAQINIKNKREIWTAQTKPLLIQTLGVIKENYHLDWHIQILDDIQNSEGVNLTFGHSPSGFKEITKTTMRSFVKRGGTIVFSQAYNGDIFVVIMYPYIEDFVTEAENKLIGRFDPSAINEGFIVENVSKFIDEMIKWEKSTSYNRVGFKI